MAHPHFVPTAYPQPAARPIRTWDLVPAIVLYVLASAAGLLAASVTPFFAMASDSCFSGTPCREELATWGILVSWGGTAVALGGGLAMMILAAVKRWQMWIGAAFALVLVPISFFAGMALAEQVTG